MNVKNKNSFLKKCVILISVPAAVCVIMEIISLLVSGNHILSTKMELYNLGKTTIQMTLTAIALSLNMSSGRMDFSLGAQQLVGCIVGGNIAFSLGMGPIATMLMCVLFGAISGFIVGMLFVITRIPSMILGIGMALIYECIGFAYCVDGFQLFGKSNMTLLANPWFQICVFLIVMTGFIVLNGYTSFGYDFRSIQGSQKVSLATGINVNKNCVICYVLAGAIISLAGVFATSYNGVLQSSMGLTSTASVFTALLPVFVAGYLSQYTNNTFALFIGALSTRIIGVALIQMKLPDPAITVINYSCILAFLLLTNFSNIFEYEKAVKNRISEANGERKVSAAK